MNERFLGYLALWQSLGFFGFLLYKIQLLRLRFFRVRRPFTLLSKHSRFRILCRPNSSDLSVFWQIFIHREYRCLDELKEAQFILDCGANVGYSAAYFLTRFPKATLIAVEPDSDNCALLEANLAGFAGRYRVVRSAIWSRETGLTWERAESDAGGEWERTVRPVETGEVPIVFATTIGTLLRESGAERISILKIDIEKSELALFAESFEEWLKRVDNLVIELHGRECESIFHQAIANQGFKVSLCDELTVCHRVKEMCGLVS